MPIHDYDGTAYYEIGKIYDDDKTVYTQIGKVHDHDGTTYNLIYSAETQFYPGTTPTILQTTDSGSYTINSTTWNCSVNNGTNKNSTTSYLKLDLTNIKTLNITGAGSGQGGVYLVTEAQQANPKGRLQWPYYVFYDPDSSIYTKKSTSFPISWDVSSDTGNYYLYLGCYTNSNGYMSANVTSVIGLE